MRRVAVVSGKGGTGKTTVAAAFAVLADPCVIADCDVDAADMHLLLEPDIERTIPFFGLQVAVKDQDACNNCGECLYRCRYGAISPVLEVITDRCEGCGVCVRICPTSAITMMDHQAGEAMLSETWAGPMAHARLDPGDDASGKLVTLVRMLADDRGEELWGEDMSSSSRDTGRTGPSGEGIILIDGPPGVGCPVIATLTGVDLALVVTEPTLSGIHDMDRVLDVAEHFSIPTMLIINKADISEENADVIEERALERGIPVAGRLPYDTVTTEAMVAGCTVMDHDGGPFQEALEKAWELVKGYLQDIGT